MKNKPTHRRKKEGTVSHVPEDLRRGASQKEAEQITRSRFSKSSIAIDQPFDYKEVIDVTGPEYVRNLHHDGVMFIPYDELKRNPPTPAIVRQECIWMKAGIINFRLCDNESDCDHCEFDRNMRRAMGDELSLRETTSAHRWPDRMREKFETVGRPCIYSLLGIPGIPSECKEGYECFRCPISEKQLERVGNESFAEPEYCTASGFKVAENCFYHLGHSWARMEKGGHVRIGIDDFAAKLFGKANAFRLPEVGASLRQGEVGLVLVRNGYQGPIQSPLSGRVVAVNTDVIENPSICHRDCYFSGWLILLEPYYLRNELKALYFGRESVEWTERENRLLLDSLGPEYERLAATGGEPTEDLFGTLPDVEWASLVLMILRTQEKR